MEKNDCNFPLQRQSRRITRRKALTRYPFHQKGEPRTALPMRNSLDRNLSRLTNSFRNGPPGLAAGTREVPDPARCRAGEGRAQPQGKRNPRLEPRGRRRPRSLRHQRAVPPRSGVRVNMTSTAKPIDAGGRHRTLHGPSCASNSRCRCAGNRHRPPNRPGRRTRLFGTTTRQSARIAIIWSMPPTTEWRRRGRSSRSSRRPRSSSTIPLGGRRP